MTRVVFAITAYPVDFIGYQPYLLQPYLLQLVPGILWYVRDWSLSLIKLKSPLQKL